MGLIFGFVVGLLSGLGLIIAFVYLEERRSLQRRRLAMLIAGMSRLTLEDTRRLIPKHLYPPWVVFTSQQKVNWLNQELCRIWPYVDQATSALLKTLLEPILEQYRPAVLDSLKFQKFTLGTIAPQITGIEMVESKEKEIIMEVEFQWDGNPSIILAVKTMVGVSLPMQVKDIGFTGVFRLIFKPLVDEFPCFGAVTYSLREIKQFDFTLKVIGGEIASVPGLSGVTEGLIRAAVTDSLLWPARKVIQVIPGDYSELELRVIGILDVKLVQGKGLLNKDFVGKSDPFAYLFIRPIPSRMKRSKTINNNLDPIWNEHFEFEVEDVATQKLIIKVFDDDGVQAAEILGCAEVELKTLEPGKITDVWLPLVKDLDEPYITRSGKYRGEVNLELCYHPLDDDKSIFLDSPLVKAPLNLTSLERVMSTSMNGTTKGVAYPRFSNSTKIKEVSIIRGILSVTVIRAEDLTGMDFHNSADPYVVLKMKKSETQKITRVIPKTLNPIWNQSFDIMVEDALHDLLIAEVWDHNTFLKKPIGKCALTLTKVLHEREHDAELHLNSGRSGKLFLHLKWRDPLPPDPQYL